MLLERTQNVDFVNAIVNDPDVRPYVGLPEIGPVDLSELICRSEHWFLMGEHGGFALLWTAPKTYEVHTFILKKGRGVWGNAARADCIDFALAHGAKILWTKIPPQGKHIERFARQGGMKPTDDVIETFGVSYRIFSMELS